MTMTAAARTPLASDLSFTVAYPVLRDALDALGKLTPGRPPVPVLGGVLFTASGRNDAVYASVFDFETFVWVELPTAAPVPAEGATLVSRDKLAKVIAGAAKGESKTTLSREVVAVDPSGPQLVTVATGGFTVPLPPLARDDYPDNPMPDACTVTVDRVALLDALGRVKTACSTDLTLPLLHGVRLETDGGVLTVAATDRFRLAVARLPHTGAGFEYPLLVDPRALHEMLRRFPGTDTVELGARYRTDTYRGGSSRVTAEWLTVRVGDAVAMLRPSDAEFPRYRQLLPAPGDVRHVRVHRPELAAAVAKAKALSAAVGERGGYLRLDVGPVGVTIVPAVDSDAIGGADAVQGRRVLAQVDDDLDGFRIGFNPDHLLDALAAFPGDQLDIGFTTPGKPVLLRAAEEAVAETPTFEWLQMPFRLP